MLFPGFWKWWVNMDIAPRGGALSDGSVKVGGGIWGRKLGEGG